MQQQLGVADVQRPLIADFIRCPKCMVSVEWIADITHMGVPAE